MQDRYLPHPDHFAKYEKVCPGAADRILKGMERQAEHRHLMERGALDLDKEDQQARRRQFARGQWFALIYALAAIVGAVYTAVALKTWHGSAFATVLGGSSLATVIIAFMYGKFRQKDEVKEESAAPP